MSNAQPIRIILAEDNAVYRLAITTSLSDDPDFQCIAEASSGDEVLRLLNDPELKPDILLLDLEMPGTHGLDVIPKVLQLRPQCRIIILTQSDREVHVLQAITRGASGYLLKTASSEEIFGSIHDVYEGGVSIAPQLAYITLQFIGRTQSSLAEEDHIQLTAREIEVLQLLSEGYGKKEIADQLGVSIHSIDNRMRRIYKKLQVQNTAAAVARAVRKGWI